MLLVITIHYDPQVLVKAARLEPIPDIKTRAETIITDSLNEYFHDFAGASLQLDSNEATGGYVGFDWEYERLDPERPPSLAEIKIDF